MKRLPSIKVFVIFCVALCLQTGIISAQKDIVTIGLCRPEVTQIKNINNLYELDLINHKKINLLCIYHENENTDYNPAREYVKREKLEWVHFVTVTGTVSKANLFKENVWTNQFKSIFRKIDAIIFTGGYDVPPGIYGAETSFLTYPQTPQRSYYEISFLFHLLGGSQKSDLVPFLSIRNKFPVLGLCLGAQSMNVATGGTLYQDIPSEIFGLKTIEQTLSLEKNNIHTSSLLRQMQPDTENLIPALHQIKLKETSLFIKRLGFKKTTCPMVLSSHHQAVKKLGKDIVIAATSMDGSVVEAIEHKRYPNVLGVQFHPEYYLIYRKGKFYREGPGKPLNENIRTIFETRFSSMEFHKKLWSWFSQNLRPVKSGI